jgi:hypothetical protein
MSGIQFDLNRLMTLVGKAEKAVPALHTEGGRSKVAFLPIGTHKLRIFYDPTGEMYRSVVTHKIGKIHTLCPDWLREQGHSGVPECRICELAREIDDWKLSPSRRFYTLIYAHLYETNNPSEWWQPNHSYVVVGKNRMKTTINSLLKTFASSSPDYILDMVNPNRSGGITTVEVTGGIQGTVTFTPLPGDTKPPIEVGDWWKPLSDGYIPRDFNLEVYQEVLAEAVKIHQGYLQTSSLEKEPGVHDPP